MMLSKISQTRLPQVGIVMQSAKHEVVSPVSQIRLPQTGPQSALQELVFCSRAEQ
jgi:hypothetical protein